MYQRNWEALQWARILANEGGSRSSKTVSLCQLLITLALEETEPVGYSICRKTMPALKATVMKDFFEELRKSDLYNENDHNKTEHTYQLGMTEFAFFSVDDAHKTRGRKQKILWLNESNEFEEEDFKQLALRTTWKIFLDYNPSDEYHWIYERVLTRKNVAVIKSTYRDNPFLDRETIAEIEQYKDLDENYWRIYGLGQRGVNTATIYPNWQLCEEIPEACDRFYGLDFGYNNPSALIDIGKKDNDHYCDELIHESHLTNSMLITRMNELGISKERPIYADAAEPQRIEEIRQAGYNIIAADKDVKKGIDTVKSSKLYITKRSAKMQKEARSYMWRTKDGKVLEEPVKANDHAMDASRYGIHTHAKQTTIIGFV